MVLSQRPNTPEALGTVHPLKGGAWGTPAVPTSHFFLSQEKVGAGLNPDKWDGLMVALGVHVRSLSPVPLPSLAGMAVLRPTWLVPCEYPHFDVPLLETLDGFQDAVLEPILNGCGSQQLGGQGTD